MLQNPLSIEFLVNDNTTDASDNYSTNLIMTQFKEEYSSCPDLVSRTVQAGLLPPITRLSSWSLS
jgi:hypothetical protein